MSHPSRPPTSELIEARRYRVTALLGKGGFGKVYRAVMEGAGGFEKDVAIKLLRDEDVPELSLQRFRDEARILGLIRDRAIVTVDPPTRLAGKWAVVMEFVDGATVQRLMKLGPIPATVVSEMVQEVARALEKVYRAPGPQGEPLRLLHRDIKPANLQITQDGEVKILDFGIARADFEHREAVTQAYVGGTRGYIAPERLDGIEGPEGDMYSLGVTAHFMLLGARPTRRQLMGLEEVPTEGLDEDTVAMIDLATRMRSPMVAERPLAREVEAICASIRRTSHGITLRRWAENNVAQAVAMGTDAMVGTVLTETIAAIPSEERLAGLMDFDGYSEQPVPPGPSMRVPILISLLGLALLVLAVVFVSAGGAAGVGYWLATTTEDVADGTPELPPPPKPKREPKLLEKVKEQPKVAPRASPPEPKSGKPVPSPRPRPARPSPKPVPVATPNGGDDDGAVFVISIASMPMGADVEVDGRSMGVTPVLNLELSAGAHQIELVGDSESTTKTITLGRRSPSRWVWVGGDKWEEYY